MLKSEARALSADLSMPRKFTAGEAWTRMNLKKGANHDGDQQAEAGEEKFDIRSKLYSVHFKP